jgi:Flp pilus assembly protein TadG
MTILRQISTILRHKTAQFVHNRDGNVALLFGLALLPVMATTGAAIDYSRASDARTQLQNALDSTVLAVAKTSPLLTDAQLRTEAEKHFRAVLQQRNDLALLPITISRNNKAVVVTAAGVLPTSFMKLFGYNSTTVASSAEAAIGQRKVELALALDNTGSMSEFGKMDQLKIATRNLIDAAEKAAPAGSGMIKVALVPYTTQVRLNEAGLGSPTWLVTQEGSAPASFNDIRAIMPKRIKWTGCLTDRGPGYDTNAKRVDMTRPESFYPGVECDRDPRKQQLATIQPLTDNWNTLRTAVDRMNPDGCTNVTIGARFGMAALSPSGTGPVGGGVDFGTPDVDKYLIVLTDGLNTRNRYTDACYKGAKPDDALPIDDKTKAMCDDIKAKSSRRDAKGSPIPDVKVFTVRVLEGNRALLTNCATNASMYKEVTSASEIDAVFKDILREITRLRLTV